MGVGVAGHLGTLKVGKIAMVSWNGGFIRFGGRGLSKERERDTRNSDYVMGWFIRQQSRVRLSRRRST